MKVDYIALSIPIFFILIGVELLYSIIKKMKLYRFNDAITNIGLGIGQQITGIFAKTVLFAGYLFLYEYHRFFTMDNSPLNIFILFMGVDFFYYWFHRCSHQINAMWAAHIVHHQSEDYNLSVALRQSWLQSFFSWVFYLPLAIIGFDPTLFLALSSFNTLYQFWIHTQALPKLGPLEWVFNTPSHHRVHHGSNPKYIDRNHAGTLIIWDRLFGTFQEEEETPVYGITKPLNSWNPIWANVHYWQELFSTSLKTESALDKLKVFYKSPGWFPKELGGKQKPQEINLEKYYKYDAHTSSIGNGYILLQFALVLGLATIFLFFKNHFYFSQQILLAGFVVVSILNLGALFEKRNWFVKLEYLRLVGFIVLALSFYQHTDFKLYLTVSIVLFLLSFTLLQTLLKRQNA